MRWLLAIAACLLAADAHAEDLCDGAWQAHFAPGAKCVATRNGAVIAPPGDAATLAAVIDEAAARYAAAFAAASKPIAIVTGGSLTRAQSEYLRAQGYIAFPWISAVQRRTLAEGAIRGQIAKQRPELTPEQRDTAVAQALAQRSNDAGGARERGALAHELGHLWFRAMFDRGTPSAGAQTRDSRTGARALDWEGEPTKAALPLRLTGGLHSLALKGVALEEVFSGALTDPEAVKAALSAALIAHDDALYPWLDGPPQTNEPGRSGALMCGLLEVAKRLGSRIEVIEIGSSAGLNLLIDRYRFDLGGTLVGPQDSPVTIRPEWRGPPPPQVGIAFEGVRGCDLQPVDVRDPAAAERLAAYVWADNHERQTRLAQAIAMIVAEPVQLVQADAADWLDARLAEPQTPGVTRVLMHSVVWQYLPPATQQRITEAMESAGALATDARPLAWVAMEPDRTLHRQEVWVRTWPDGAPKMMVAASQAHGAWVEGWI